MDNGPSTLGSDKEQEPRTRDDRPRAFLGVRSPELRFALVLVVVAALGVGAYLTYDRYVLEPKRHEDIASGAEAAKRHARWQRSGRRGWERLLKEAAKGMPGYSVDTGRPARLKLAEVGPEVAPFVEEKLESDVYAERLTAIYVLSAAGAQTDRIAGLLLSELEHATDGQGEIGALKCAASLLDRPVVLAEVSFAALESPRAKTRRTAVAYLFGLRNARGAPPAVGERLAKLRAEGDPKLQLEMAVHLIDEDGVGSYRTLLEGLDSADEETALIAIHLVALLRGEGSVNPKTATAQEKAEAIEAHRAWLDQKISEPQGQETSEDSPVEETPQPTRPAED